MLRTVFPTGTESFVHGDYTSPIGSVHMMMEGFDFDCDQTMFDDIVVKRYTGSPEQAAAINSAVQPSDVLFAEDFESGSGGWHGKDANERPETAIVMEDPDGNHGFVMAMTDCVGGGDAFGKATFVTHLVEAFGRQLLAGPSLGTAISIAANAAATCSGAPQDGERTPSPGAASDAKRQRQGAQLGTEPSLNEDGEDGGADAESSAEGGHAVHR